MVPLTKKSLESTTKSHAHCTSSLSYAILLCAHIRSLTHNTVRWLYQSRVVGHATIITCVTLLLHALIPCLAAYILPSSPVLLHIYCPHPLSCCIYTALVSLLFCTVIPTSFNILMDMFFSLVYIESLPTLSDMHTCTCTGVKTKCLWIYRDCSMKQSMFRHKLPFTYHGLHNDTRSGFCVLHSHNLTMESWNFHVGLLALESIYQQEPLSMEYVLISHCRKCLLHACMYHRHACMYSLVP